MMNHFKYPYPHMPQNRALPELKNSTHNSVKKDKTE